MEKRSNGIDITRLIIAVLTVACHSNLFIDVNTELYNIVSRYFVRSFVVYFLMVSGYYYIAGLINSTVDFSSRFFKILKTYLVWTVIYYAFSFINSIIINQEDLGEFLMQRLRYFFIDGSFYHLWYFLALLYSLILVTIIYKFFNEKGLFALAVVAVFINVVCVFGRAYIFSGEKIPILSEFFGFGGFHQFVLIVAIGLSSFSGGYFIYLAKNKYKASFLPITIMSVVFVSEMLFLVLVMKSTLYPELFFSVYPFAACLVLTLLKHPTKKLKTLATFSRKTAGFIYFVHPLVILSVKGIFEVYNVSLGSTALFFVSLSIVFILSFILSKMNNRMSKVLMGR